MREILFRGKRMTDGRWVYGDYHKYTCTTSGITPTPTHYIMGTDASSKVQIWVDPATVGQYTGLTDKNGVKIFDGDILSIENPKPFNPAIELVKFERVKWIAGVMELDEVIDRWPISIIGNIHDTPELLEDSSNAPTN